MNRASRIAMDLRAVSPRATGVGRSILCLSKALVAAPPARRFFLLTDAPENLAMFAGAPNAEVVRVPFAQTDHPRADVWLNTRLGALLRGLGASAYHGPAFIIPLLNPGVPVVQTIHDLSCFQRADWSPWRFRLYMRCMIRLGARRAAQIAVPSEAARSEVLARFRLPPGKVVVVPWASTAGDERPSPDAIAKHARSLNLPARYVLAIGALEPRKNPLALAGALSSIPAPERPALVWAGANEHRSGALMAAMRERLGAGLIRAHGFDDRRLDLLRAGAAAVVVPSWHEGFSLPVLEAMAGGVPVVCSDIPAHRELAGEAALFAEPGDEAALGVAVRRLLNDPGLSERLVHAGRVRAARFSWRAAADKMLEVFDGAMPPSRA